MGDFPPELNSHQSTNSGEKHQLSDDNIDCATLSTEKNDCSATAARLKHDSIHLMKQNSSNHDDKALVSSVLRVPAASNPAPDGGWGWVIVVVSFLCAGVVDGLCSVFGVLLPSLMEYFDQSSSRTAFAGSLLAGGFLLFGPVASVLINRFGCRVTTIVGAIFSAVSLIASPFSPNVEVFILLFGGLGGFGISLIYLPASVMVGYYFERRRGLAAGIASSGAGFGMLILSPLAAFLVAEYSWKGTLTILAGISLNCIAWGALMRPLPQNKAAHRIPNNVSPEDGLEVKTSSIDKKSEPIESEPTENKLNLVTNLISSKQRMNSESSHEEGHDRLSTGQSEVTGPLQRKDIFYMGSVVSLPQEDCTVDSAISDKQSRCCQRSPAMFVTLWEMLDVSLFRNPSFVVICIASVFIQLGYFVPVVFITPYALSLGISQSAAAMLLSVIGISNMVGRTGAGALATVPCVNTLLFNVISLIITGLATALVTVLCHGFMSLVVYSIVFGLSVGVFVPLTTIFLVEYVGLDKLTNAYGLMSMVKGVATMIGPPVAGALLDATKTYSSTFYFAGLMFIVSGILYYFLKLPQHCSKYRTRSRTI